MKTKLGLGLALGLLLAANSSGAGRPSHTTPNKESATITVGVYDYAHTKSAKLLEAEQAAASILRKAGVGVVWLACPTDDTSQEVPGCATQGDLTHLTLRLLPNAMSNRLRQMHGDALGFALLGEKPSCDAWVFVERINAFAVEQQLTFEPLLGGVIAHELGHLLLNENRHSDSGLMRAHWSRGELLAIEFQHLLFSRTEQEKIQTGAIARAQMASATLAELVPLADGRPSTR